MSVDYFTVAKGEENRINEGLRQRAKSADDVISITSEKNEDNKVIYRVWYKR